MATPKHFAILQLGVSIWNQWRAAEPLVVPNLRNADLRGLDLENINLCRANLRGANLSHVYLYDADFQEADLSHANLTRAGLIGANLHRANLSDAVLKNAYLAQSDLSNANFTGACLQAADFQAALLTRAIFKNASIAEAELSDSFDLTQGQLESTQDAHLAWFDHVLKTELGMSHSPSHLGADAPDLLPVAHSQHGQPIEVFQPTTREPTLTRPKLRRLAVG